MLRIRLKSFMIKINKELNMKVFSLVVLSLISGAFIKEVSDSITNSIPLLKIWWFFMVPIFLIVDLIVWVKTGEEIITWILEQLGIEFD